MAIKTFTLIAPSGTTPTVTLRHPTTHAVLGTATASPVTPGSSHYTVSVEIGSYSGDFLADMTSPSGGFYGNTSESSLRDAPVFRESGSGPFPLTVTVKIGDTLVSGVILKISTAELSVAWGTTNSFGQVPFQLDEGDYIVTVRSEAGFVPLDPIEVTVPDESELEITLTAQEIEPPSSSDVVTGKLIAFDENGAVEVGAGISIQAIQTGKGLSGKAYDSQVRTIQSDANGLVVIPGLHPGLTYKIKRGGGPEYTAKIPENATGIIELPDILGHE